MQYPKEWPPFMTKPATKKEMAVVKLMIEQRGLKKRTLEAAQLLLWKYRIEKLLDDLIPRG